MSSPEPQPSMPPAAVAGALVLPLALCQFVASYATSAMNVSISDIAKDLGTTVSGVQVAITLFTLTMSALMIPGSKLTDIWGRKRCLLLGLGTYGTGGLIAALAPSLPVLIVGYSLFEGVGSALMIPPVYILITVWFREVSTRARYFGVVSGAAGVGAAAGPLVGGVLTTAVSWRLSFFAQVALVAVVVLLSRRISEPARPASRPKLDLLGVVVSAVGLLLVVVGVLLSSTYGWIVSREDFSIGGTVVIPKGGPSPVWLFVVAGLGVLALFFVHVRATERRGGTPLLSTRLFRNRASNLGLVMQNVQWLVLQGSFFVISVFLQTARHFNAIETGLMLTPATAGILLSAAAADRMARRRSQKGIIVFGFVLTLAGMVLLLLLVRETSALWTFLPGLFAMGVGVGAMLTAAVNVVQGSFPDSDQGEISGLSRSVSNLGSSFGTAIAGSVLVSALFEGNIAYVAAIGVLVAAAFVGLGASVLLPRGSAGAEGEARGPRGRPGPAEASTADAA